VLALLDGAAPASVFRRGDGDGDDDEIERDEVEEDRDVEDDVADLDADAFADDLLRPFATFGDSNDIVAAWNF
jgi:hypothetical protein